MGVGGETGREAFPVAALAAWSAFSFPGIP
jgi:hypothetical protein